MGEVVSTIPSEFWFTDSSFLLLVGVVGFDVVPRVCCCSNRVQRGDGTVQQHQVPSMGSR